MTHTAPAAVVVLAAGEGTRMRSSTPKVLHRACGRTLLDHVLTAASGLDPATTLVVVGHGQAQVTASLEGSGARPVVQDEQRGTGHAVRIALAAAPDVDGTVLVVPGDTPLLTEATLRRLVAEHEQIGAAVTVLTAVSDDPSGYGRVLTDRNGRVTRVVEHRDASPEEREVREWATSVYAFASGPLRSALARLRTDNVQGEEYLTDVVELAVADGLVVTAVRADEAEVQGVNDRVQLAAVNRALADRLLEYWMRSGVTVVDPVTTWIDVDARLEPDVTVHPNTQLHGATSVARGASLGPDSTLTDTTVGENATVVRAHCQGAEIGPEVAVGPFAYLRPGTVLRAGAKVGTFVEVKAARIGEGTKVPHLTYVGDATIGEHSNIGASTVFVNYDGERKHATVIGSHVRSGADNMFVAPVSVGDGAYTGAGTVVRRDVPAGALAVSGGPQRNIDGWVQRRRADSDAARAARRARESGGTDDGGRDDRTMTGQGH